MISGPAQQAKCGPKAGGGGTAIRGRRVITPAGERAATVLVRDGVMAGLAGYPAAPDGAVTLAADDGAAARAGGQPRARERAGPHRVGGVRHRHGGGRRGRCDHDRGHAAEQHPADRRPCAALARQAGRGRGPAGGRRRVLGRRGAGQPRRPARAARGGGGRVQVLPAALRRGRVPAAGRRPARPRPWPRSPRSAACSSRTPRTRRDRRRRPPRTAAGTRTSWPPGRPRPRCGRSRHCWRTTRRTGCRTHIVHLSSAGALPVIRAARGGRAAGHRGDLPALPDAARPRTCPTAPPSSSAARRSATRPTATQLWDGLPDGTIDCVVSDHSPCTVADKRLDTGLTSARPGAASPRSSSACRWSGPRRPGAASAWPRWRAGWPPPRPG